MAAESKKWKEKEWEAYANQLLATHHAIFGGSYQRVPDHGGDKGLEGFTNLGDSYQAYADQNSKTIEQRTEKQKKKIRQDLKKLQTNEEFWREVLGETKMKHWTLVVPAFEDKEVIRYAKTQERKLLRAGLTIIDPSFYVDVKSAEDFPAAKAFLRDPALPRAQHDPVADADIEEFRNKQPTFIENLRRKLATAIPHAGSEQIDSNVDHWLNWHLTASNLSDALESEFPALWETLDELIDVTAKSIETETLLDTRLPHNRLRETRTDFESNLGSNQFQFLTDADKKTVSHGVVAKWLGECPLDFLGAANG